MRYSALLMHKSSLQIFFEKYVQGTAEGEYVLIDQLTLCIVTKKVAQVLGFHKRLSVSISTRALKHLYDKKPAEEFSCILEAIDKIIRYPKHVYKNKSNKKGNYCFVGEYKSTDYICSVEIMDDEGQIVTCFRKRDPKYLHEYILLWSREVDDPPS
jgi:hypothetical protein